MPLYRCIFRGALIRELLFLRLGNQKFLICPQGPASTGRGLLWRCFAERHDMEK